ncbi:MAG: glycosyltransferase family 4 protein [Melioribacteraceae bacterium]|nr:glycosyltransferase family 4 protein [Melioribacteraceae bacterium]
MKKVLIITYYWPPSGGPGVQRVLKFAKYLPQFGWMPIILTVEKGNYPDYDKSLMNEIPNGTKVYKTKSFEPFEIYKSMTGRTGSDRIPTFELNKKNRLSAVEKLSRWLRANVFIPDAKIGWTRHIESEGLKIIEEEKPDIILSSSPPHSLQIGAMKLAQKSGVKWVADFRDPWTNAFWQKDLKRSGFALSKDRKMEHDVLFNADKVVAVSSTIASMFEIIASNKTRVITNGFDPEDFQTAKVKRDKFTITYTGTLGESQKIDNFINAINGLNDSIKNEIEINFFGSFHPSILSLQDKCRNINFYNSIPHDRAVPEIINSDILLLVIPYAKENKGILTGKLFEYMATGNFILGIGPVSGEAASILNESGSGNMFDYGDDLGEIILSKFNEWKNGIGFSADKEKINRYSRINTTSQLINVFEELI